MQIADFKVGKTYNGQEIMDAFGNSMRGGMNRSHKTDTLVIVSKQTVIRKKSVPYEDKWINGKLHYIGEGQSGNQDINFRQNKTLANSENLSITMHLFEVFEPTEYIYRGIVRLLDEPYQMEELDAEHRMRTVWKFPLTVVSRKSVPSYQYLKDLNDQKENLVLKQSNNQIKDFAFKVSEENKKYYTQSNEKNKIYRKAITKIYDEDPYISQYVKNLAKGICSLCHEKAPFTDKNNQPYLIAHRIEPLSQGGPDTIEYTVAVCPNCHERLKILNIDEDKARLRKVIKAR